MNFKTVSNENYIVAIASIVEILTEGQKFYYCASICYSSDE